MPIDVRGPDGTIYRVNTDDEEVARATVRRALANGGQNRTRSSNPQGRRPNAQTVTPRTPAEQAVDQERALRAPRGAPGTPLRALEDFNRNGIGGVVSQAWRQVPFSDEFANWINGPGAEEYQRQERERYARQNPGGNAAATAMNVIGLAGAPVATGPISALRAGAAAAGVNAPFALARQEGTLQERIPGALAETATVGVFGTALQGLANRLAPTAVRPNSVQARAADFEAAGVRPTLAAVSGGAPAGMTKIIAENFIAGPGVRARLASSIDDTAQASRNLAAQYAQHGQPEQVGETVQRGIRRFVGSASDPMPNVTRPNRAGVARTAPAREIPVRGWSFKGKANALYDDVFGRIEGDEAQHLAGETGVRATADATRQLLNSLVAQERISPAVSEMVANPLVRRVADALEADQGQLTFQTLRRLRTFIRDAQGDPQLMQGMSPAQLQRVEAALTDDIYRSAREIGGEAAANDLRAVDRWYRRVSGRIQEVLQPFADRSGRGAYDRIIDLAREGRQQNTRALRQLRSSLRDDEWREVSATIIDNLGAPTAANPANAEAGAFSVEQFFTNYSKLSPEGRRILFGGSGRDDLHQALETLWRVAGYQKGVEAMANRSRSGVNLQNVGTFGGLTNTVSAGPTLAALAGMAVTGEMLTNPAFVRWLASAPRAGAGPGGMRRQLAALAQIAARDPALAPFYTELAQRVGDQSPARQEQRQQMPERTQ